MIDDLREQTDDSFYSEDEDDDSYLYEDVSTPASEQFLGMTPPQRFVIAAMLMLMVCVLGTFFLLVTEKIYLPFL
jgi:hypothetical protein